MHFTLYFVAWSGGDCSISLYYNYFLLIPHSFKHNRLVAAAARVIPTVVQLSACHAYRARVAKGSTNTRNTAVFSQIEPIRYFAAQAAGHIFHAETCNTAHAAVHCVRPSSGGSALPPYLATGAQPGVEALGYVVAAAARGVVEWHCGAKCEYLLR